MNSWWDIRGDDDSVIQSLQPRARATRSRFWLPTAVLVLIGTALLGRSFWLQIVHGANFRDRAEHNRIYQIITDAPRGIIYDRNGVPLVSNISATDLVFDPRSLPAREQESSLIDNLLAILPSIDPSHLQQLLQQSRSTGQVVPIARAIEHEKVLALEEAGSSIQGTKLVSSLVRKYEKGNEFAHILGYSNLVSANDLKENPKLLLTDKIGKQGIEKEYDGELRGTAGITYQEVDARGHLLQEISSQTPTPGQNIQLTVDADLQDFIYSLFSERDKKQAEEGNDTPTAGAVAVIDPRSGDVLAAVSYPSYNPNAFSQPQSDQDVSEYIHDKRRPLFNRLVDGTYPSGSTIKPILAGAALQEGIITPQTTVLSTGGLSIGPWTFPDWKAGGHGVTNVTKALAESVNTFFYEITGGYKDQPGLGVKRATSYLQKFGWGSPTEIDLPSEASGFLPSPEWKQRVKGESWYIGDTYHLGIGQGDILATPLQIAVSTAAIADGRYLRQPHFVRTHTDTKKKEIPISLDNIRVVQAGMRQAVTDGSARSLKTLPIPVAGKTGTAQVGGSDKTHAWFTSFGPYGDPQIAITVLLEYGGAGDSQAVPLAKEIWQWWIENRYNANANS